MVQRIVTISFSPTGTTSAIVQSIGENSIKPCHFLAATIVLRCQTNATTSVSTTQIRSSSLPCLPMPEGFPTKPFRFCNPCSTVTPLLLRLLSPLVTAATIVL